MTKNLDTKKPKRAFFFDEPFEANYIPDILDEIYKKKVYEPFLLGKKDLTIIDVGCNIGLFTYYASQYAKTIYALEPSSRHFDIMTYMFMYNELDNVVSIQKALSNKIGKTKFYHNDNKTMFSLESSVNKIDDFEIVETIPFDNLFLDNKIESVDLCKLDVEGHEGVIINSDGFKKVADKIKVICGEWHQWSGVSQPNFQHALEDLGYTFRWRHDTAAQVFEAQRI